MFRDLKWCKTVEDKLIIFCTNLNGGCTYGMAAVSSHNEYFDLVI